MSSMKGILHELLTKVRVISKIEEGQSLDTTNGFSIYKKGFFAWFWRKLGGDNKNECVRAISDLFKLLNQTVIAVLDEYKNTASLEKSTAILYDLKNTALGIKDSMKGLDNLAKTYQQWPAIVAKLEGIIKDFIVVTYDAILRTMSGADMLTNELQENLIFCNVIVYKVELEEDTKE